MTYTYTFPLLTPPVKLAGIYLSGCCFVICNAHPLFLLWLHYMTKPNGMAQRHRQLLARM